MYLLTKIKYCFWKCKYLTLENQRKVFFWALKSSFEQQKLNIKAEKKSKNEIKIFKIKFPNRVGSPGLRLNLGQLQHVLVWPQRASNTQCRDLF